MKDGEYMELSVSILSIKENINKNIELLSKCKIDYLHLDIMDGKFVPNETWNINEIKEILSSNTKELDVHLMVYDLEKYIIDFANLRPKYITFHIEAMDNPQKYIDLIKSKNIKVGISIKPKTDLSLILPYLNQVDLVLVMSVEPGFGGQKFIASSIERIDSLYQLRQLHNYNYVIEVDGGINKETIDYCRKCDVVVVGSYITNNNYEESIKSLNL